MPNRILPTKLPFHDRIIKEMDGVAWGKDTAVRRAVRAANELMTTAVPEKHMGAVVASYTAMIDRLGGTNNSRRLNRYERDLLKAVSTALDVQPAPEAQASDQLVDNGDDTVREEARDSGETVGGTSTESADDGEDQRAQPGPLIDSRVGAAGQLQQ